MNKKLYVMPETEIVLVETQGMLAASIGGADDDNTIGSGDKNPVGDDFNPDNY